MAFADGDFVKVDYSVWRNADNKLLSTTKEGFARENGIYEEQAKYAPQLVVIGKHDTIKGVEEALRSMSLGEEKKIVVEPKDAFGERDPKLVRIIPISDFKKRNIDPYQGMRLDIDGVEAIVKSVNSGRVVVDENNELAGERLTYEIKVVEKIDSDIDRIKAVAEKLGTKVSTASITNGTAHVELDEKEKNEEYEARKSVLPSYIFKYMPNINKVEILDIYERPAEQSKEKEQKSNQLN
ncbi:MAG: peptidylprolyl isomerase [Candidatus Micrarchaeaceae archaeon]